MLRVTTLYAGVGGGDGEVLHAVPDPSAGRGAGPLARRASRSGSVCRVRCRPSARGVAVGS